MPGVRNKRQVVQRTTHQQMALHYNSYIFVVLLLLLRSLCLYCSNVPWKGFTVPPSTCHSSSTVEEMRCWSWLTISTPPWKVARPYIGSSSCWSWCKSNQANWPAPSIASILTGLVLTYSGFQQALTCRLTVNACDAHKVHMST